VGDVLEIGGLRRGTAREAVGQLDELRNFLLSFGIQSLLAGHPGIPCLVVAGFASQDSDAFVLQLDFVLQGFDLLGRRVARDLAG